MESSVIFFAWDRSIPGRELLSAEHFQDFVKYLGELKGKGSIESFDTVFLDLHGGDCNGFFLIKGRRSQIDALCSTIEWITHMTRAGMHLQQSGAVRGVTGDSVMERMALWTKLTPQ
jgi:hypothetical protein